MALVFWLVELACAVTAVARGSPEIFRIYKYTFFILVFSQYVYFDFFFPTKFFLSGVRKKPIKPIFLPTNELGFVMLHIENKCSVSANMEENSNYPRELKVISS